MTQSDLTGNVFDNRFRILGALGAGTYGTVYKAKHGDLQRIVALKVLSLAPVSGQFARGRFEREVQALASLHHENIVTVYGCGMDSDQRPYLWMEFLDGKTLRDVLAEEGRLDWRRAARIGIRICAALSAAHAGGIVHRDINPRNIMLLPGDDAEMVKVLDFGLSTLLPECDRSLQKLTQTGAVVGTVLYISPEGVIGSKVDARADIYSLGCVLYECVSGHPVFAADDPAAILRSQCLDLPTPISSLAGSQPIPRELELIIFKAMQKDPAHRFASAEEFSEALKLALADRANSLDLTGVQLIVGRPRQGRNSKKLLLAGMLCMIAICVVAMGGFATWWNERRQSDKSPPVTVQSPAMADRAADCAEARELLSQARSSKAKGDLSGADALARLALMRIGHEYPDELLIHSTVRDDIEILNEIADIYDQGRLLGKMKPAPFARARDILEATIQARDTQLFNAGDESELLSASAVLAAVYGEHELAGSWLALNITNESKRHAFGHARTALQLADQLALQTGDASISNSYTMDIARARLLFLEGNKEGSRVQLDQAWKGIVQDREGPKDKRFFQWLAIAEAEGDFGNKAAVERALEEAYKAALAAHESVKYGAYSASEVAEDRRLAFLKSLKPQAIGHPLEARVDDSIKQLSGQAPK
jgi:serine/threonine protein kinase